MKLTPPPLTNVKPDYQRAAIKAAHVLIENDIRSAPVMPLPIFKRMHGCIVLSFTEMSNRIGMNRENLITAFDAENHDAVTSVHFEDGKLRYLVTYNQRLPLYLVQRALAREMGHYVLGHTGNLPEEVRMAEAHAFASYLLCPRPLIHAVQESNIPLTVEVLGAMTGCYERCLQGMRKTPGVSIPKELNQQVREKFSDYIENFLDYESYLTKSDESMLANLGTYMDGYEE